MMTAKPVSASVRANTAAALAKNNQCVWKTRLEKNQASVLARLVKEARLLSAQELVEASEIAESLQQSVDQVLLNSGFLHEEIAKLCARALLFIEERNCAESLVVQGLMTAVRKRLSLEEGLRYYGWGW